MSEIDDYISEARQKHGATDAEIKKQLESAGWDGSTIDTALGGSGLPPAPKPHEAAAHSVQRKGLTPLAAAMHHILLWFFTCSASITVPVVISALYSGGDATAAIASYVAVVLVTLTPYSLIYIAFLRKFRADPSITANKIWSIITVVFHTIGVLGSLITLIISLIVEPIPVVVLSAVAIGILDLLVLVTYFAATFVKPENHSFRKVVLFSYLPVVVSGLAVIAVISLLRLGPAKHDTNQKIKLVAVVQGIREYYVDHNNTLPANLNQIDAPDKSGISYERQGSELYTVCAEFKNAYKRNGSSTYYDYYDDVRSDTYVYEGYFTPDNNGKNCFDFRTVPTSKQGVEIYNNTLD